MIKTGVSNGVFYMSTPYNANFVSDIKTVHGARFTDVESDGYTIRKVWTVPVSSKDMALQLLEKHYPGEMAASKVERIKITAATPAEARRIVMDSDDGVESALLMLYRHQTSEEQMVHGTVEENAMGFNKPDAGYCSFLARQVLDKKPLTPGQLERARQLLAKYSRQLVGLTGTVLPEEEKQKVKAIEESDKNNFIVAYFGNRTTPDTKEVGPLGRDDANKKWSSYKQPDSQAFKLEAYKLEDGVKKKVTEWIRPSRFVASLTTDNMIGVKGAFEDKDLIKGWKGATWDVQDKIWKLPLTESSVNILNEYDSTVDKQVVEAIENKKRNVADLQNIARQGDVTISHPAGGKLRSFQRTGVKFLTTAKRAILGDDMGLGKSLESIIATEELGCRNVLIIVPNSLKRNWQKEYIKWNIRPESDITIITGDKAHRDNLFKSFSGGVLIINYDHVRPDRPNHIEDLGKFKWDAVIVDEAHKIKHKEAQQTTGVQQLCHKAQKACFLLTGTPPGEVHYMWNLLHAIKPEEYPSYWKFVRDNTEIYQQYVGRDKTVTKITGVPLDAPKFRKEILDPSMIRRLKTEHLPDLPEKQYREVWVDMEPAQEKIYKQMLNSMAAEVEAGKQVTAAVVLAQLNRLRQIAVSPDIMTPEIEDYDAAAKRSNKIKAMMDIVEGTNGKVVIFSQYERAVSLATKALEKENYKYVRFTGKENEKERDKSVEAFMHDPSVKAIVMTTSAGGLGLTLTAASDAIFLDKMWNPEDNSQAEDRIHRIGQLDSKVTIHEILSEGTLDEWVERLLTQKTKVDASVMDICNKYHDSRQLAMKLRSIASGGNDTSEHMLSTVSKTKVSRSKPSLKASITPGITTL